MENNSLISGSDIGGESGTPDDNPVEDPNAADLIKKKLIDS